MPELDINDPGTRKTVLTQRELQLGIAACLALRAWIRADSPDLSPVERDLLLAQARMLTGRAVAHGLLRRPIRDGEEEVREAQVNGIAE